MADSGTVGFELADYQRELAQAARRFGRAHAAVSRTRTLMTEERSYDPAVYRRFAAELGIAGLRVPERFGGSGAGFVEVGLVAYELGRLCYSGPYLATVIALELLIESGDQSALEDYAAPLAAGELTAAPAWAESAGPVTGREITTEATRTEDGWRLRGRKRFVVNGDTADLLLVTARTPTGTSLFALSADAPGLARRARSTLDQTRAMSDLELNDAPGRLIGTDGAATSVVAKAFDHACIALAAESIGVADAALDMTVEYLKQRRQFGRPIGSFQALKHRCADLVMSLELARCAVDYATRAVDMGADDVSAAAAIAVAEAADIAMRTTGECIQMHGGIGFTWEHDAHLYFKRARANAALFGTVADHRERMLQIIGV